MRINLASSQQGIERFYYLAVLALLLAVVIVATGCTKEEKTGGNPQPMPTPPPADDMMGDTPIIISGGSIHLDFNKKIFKPCATATPPQPCPTPSSATEKVYWATGKISRAFIYNDNDVAGDTPLELTNVDGKSTITIKGKMGGDIGDIIIRSIPAIGGAANKIVTIQVDEGKFVPRGTGYRRTNKKLKVDDVIVKDKNDVTTSYKTKPGYPPNNKMTIEIQ